MKKWSRRKFLKAGLASSITMSRAAATRPSPAHAEARTQKQPSTKSTFGAGEQQLLLIAMDEIIPAGDGMPAASEVGCLDYLDRLAGRDRQLASGLRRGLEALETLSGRRFRASFVSLSHGQRVETLAAFERQNADAFGALRDYVYEAYYTQPKVWKLIGYDLYPTNEAGPHLKPFDDAALAEVRKKPRYYREI